MLARLAATLRERQALRGGMDGPVGTEIEGGTIVLDENCSVSLRTRTFLSVSQHRCIFSFRS
jgi:hypothetical protein